MPVLDIELALALAIDICKKVLQKVELWLDLQKVAHF